MGGKARGQCGLEDGIEGDTDGITKRTSGPEGRDAVNLAPERGGKGSRPAFGLAACAPWTCLASCANPEVRSDLSRQDIVGAPQFDDRFFEIVPGVPIGR